jgi:hypothetical protein
MANWSQDFIPETIEPQIGRPSVGFMEGAGIGFREGLNSTIPGLALRHLKTLPGARINEEEFNNTIYPSAGITWNNRMTWAEAQSAYDARTDKQVYDDAARRMTTGGKAGEIVGNLGGGILDPVNLLPLGGMNLAAGFLRNVARVGAANAALEASLYQPLEAAIASKEQMPYTASQYAMNVALAGAIGGIFGGGAYGIAKFLETRALRLGELGQSTTETADPALVQRIAIDAPNSPQEAPTSVLQQPTAPVASATTPNAPNAPVRQLETAPTVAENSAGLGSNTASVSSGTTRQEIAVRFPDADHQRLYNIDINNPQDRAWLELTGYTLEDVNTYREAVQRRIDGQEQVLKRGAEPEVPAPRIMEVNLDKSSGVYSDQTFAMSLQDRFNTVSPNENKYEANRKILQEELQRRAEFLAQQDDPSRPVPNREPREGVLDQSFSKDNEGQVVELPVREWLRRQFNPAFGETIMRKEGKGGPGEAVSYARRPDWENNLLKALQRLTPEQLDYTLHHLLNESDLAALTRKLDGTPADTVANARFVQEQIQPRGSEAYGGATLADRTIEAENIERLAELHRRLDEEARAVNTSATDGHDKLTGIDAVKSPQDAAKFIAERYEVEKLRTMSPDAERAARNLERLQKKQSAIVQTMACLLGAR